MKSDFLSLKNINISLPSKIILQAVDLNIAQGAMVAIVGANGVGKTTFLKLLCGLCKPSAGELLIDNYSYSDSQQAMIIRKMLGYAPDHPPLYAQDTVESYLHFVAALKQVAKSEIPAQVADMLDIFALNDYRTSLIHTLSKGTQQRVNLAQALIHKPKFLVLDEPTNALDSEQCAKFIQHLQLLRKQQVTIILASHNYTDVIALCDYMLKINQQTLEKTLLPLPTKVTEYAFANYTS